MHDWHPFDVDKGYEVRRVDEFSWELRDREGHEWTLSLAEFDQLRSTGVNPQDIP